ncbi:MAG: hypothetical protein ACYDA6_00175 [Solirubrobacteraceae bacterium]
MDDSDVAITELTRLDVERLDAVGSPANGTPWLVLKQLEEPDPVEKAKLSAADIDDLPDSDFAFIESGGTKDGSGKTVPRGKRHFPLVDAAHVRDALGRAPQSPFGDKAMPKIKAAAEKMGIEVAKATGDDQTPGSPEWEATDAANLRQAATLLASLRDKLSDAASRERTEATSPDVDDSDDFENAWDLDTACQALDCALGIVARLAFTEQQEADAPADDATVAKAGKKLSAATTNRIKAARDHLSAASTHLSGLLGEDADTTDSKETEVTKAEIEAMLSEALGAAVAEAVTKELEAISAAAALAPATEPTEPTPAESEVAKSDGDSAASDEPVAKSETDTPATTPATADLTEVVKAAVADAQSATSEVIKAALAPLSEVFKGLEDRLAVVEAQPAPGGPLLSGAAHADTNGFVALRGQASGDAETVRLQKALESAGSPNEREAIANEISQRNLTRFFGGS